jgi:DNA-binding NarL/FixJ family response regulator
LIRVILVARGLATRVGLRALFESDPRFAVSDDAASVASLDVPSEDAHVLVLDGQGIDIEDLPNVAWDISGVILIGGSSRLRAALLGDGGPVGLLGSEASAQQIHAAVIAVAAGLSVVEPESSSELRISPFHDDEIDAPELTAREREVLGLVAAGLPNKGIAARLSISEHTVKYHLASVLTKLGAASRAEAVARAARRGLIAL